MVERKPLHIRHVTIESFERSDGLWDFEATLVDTKAYDFQKSNGTTQRAGTPVHDMTICVTVNAQGEVVDAKANYDTAPYGNVCSAIEEAYQGLVGLSLVRGFRQRVRERFLKTAGCTHMSELVSQVPTVYFQTLSKIRERQAQRERVDATQQLSERSAQSTAPQAVRQADESQQQRPETAPKRPFQLEGCHAYALHSPVVKEFYPQWYEPRSQEETHEA